MGKELERIDAKLRRWIAKQALFFVGTAPRDVRGHVNVSPKGPIGSLRVVDERTIAYLDAVGSGVETIAHIRENGRVVVMLCAFDGPPRILRLHGRGRVAVRGTAEFDALVARCAFDDPGLPETRRAVIVVDVTRVADSCGYGVPRMEFVGPRPQMTAWGRRKLEQGGAGRIELYVREKNARSIDGLPGLGRTRRAPAKRRGR
jgi:hypothetical protein